MLFRSAHGPTHRGGNCRKIIVLAVFTDFFGASFAIPLRRYCISIQMLSFPTPAATAFTIRVLHNRTQGVVTPAKKIKGLRLLFGCRPPFVGIYAPTITAYQLDSLPPRPH